MSHVTQHNLVKGKINRINAPECSVRYCVLPPRAVDINNMKTTNDWDGWGVFSFCCSYRLATLHNAQCLSVSSGNVSYWVGVRVNKIALSEHTVRHSFDAGCRQTDTDIWTGWLEWRGRSGRESERKGGGWEEEGWFIHRDQQPSFRRGGVGRD